MYVCSLPYTVVADFESVLELIKEPKGKGEKFQHHKPVSYRFNRVRYDGESGPLKEFAGEDAPKHFIMAMIHEYFQIRDIYSNPKSMISLNDEEKQSHISATHCWICEEEFNNDHIKVMDHCHITGKYRGAAHSEIGRASCRERV